MFLYIRYVVSTIDIMLSLCHSWSFGVVMWEIFTLGEVPYVDIVDNDDVSQYVREGNRLERPSGCPESMLVRGLFCVIKQMSLQC